MLREVLGLPQPCGKESPQLGGQKAERAPVPGNLYEEHQEGPGRHLVRWGAGLREPWKWAWWPGLVTGAGGGPEGSLPKHPGPGLERQCWLGEHHWGPVSGGAYRAPRRDVYSPHRTRAVEQPKMEKLDGRHVTQSY